MKLRLLTVVIIAITATLLVVVKTTEPSIEDLRTKHLQYIEDSPFKASDNWSKKERKLKGLPPNKYFEQLWELTINPFTGRLDDGKLTLLREELKQERLLNRSIGDDTNAWEERGPNNVGGRTRAILFDPNDSSNNTVFAGGVSGGLWKNTDISNSGSQWARVENVPGNLAVSSITVDPNNSNIWYVGTGEQYTGGDVVGNGVYKSIDGGTTWTPLNIPAAGDATFDYSASNLFLSGLFYVNDVIAWDNNGTTELFVGVGAYIYGDATGPNNWLGLQTAGIYRSIDGGTNWSRIEQANMSHSTGGKTYYYIPNDFEISADNTLWLGTIGNAFGQGRGHVYSTTNGATWTEANASPLTDSNRVELEPSASNSNKLYALTQGVTSKVHIYETTDAFNTITSKTLPNDADPGIPSNDFCRGQAFYDLVIEADPADDDIVYVGGIDLFKSTNGGGSWSQLSHWYGGFGYQYVHADQHAIAFGNSSSSKMVFGTDGGMYYSANAGSNISVRNNNYNVTQFVKAGVGPDGNGDTDGIFSAGSQDNGTQAFRNIATGINSSEESSDGDGFYTFIDKDGEYMITTYVYNVIYRFNLPWNGIPRIQGGATTLSSDQSRGDFVNQMDFDSEANRLLTNNSNSSQNAIKSINVVNGSNGSLTDSDLTAEPSAFRASPFETNVWYVGLKNGVLLRLTNVTDNSATFSAITTPFIGSISSVRFGDTLNDIFVTIHNYGVTSVWYSSDAGANWVSKEGDLPDIPVRDILQNPLNSDEVIIATQLGVWSTDNFYASSPNWVQSYNGMSDVSVTAFDYWAIDNDDTNNIVIASTYGRGIFTGAFTEPPPVVYTYDGSWSPNDPSGTSTINDELIINSGNATLSNNTTSSSLTINDGASLTIENGVTLTAATVTLNSTSTSYSSLILNGNISGTVAYNRAVNAYTNDGNSNDNDLITAPLSGQTFGAFANDAANANLLASDDVRAFAPFDKTTGNYTNYNIVDDASTVITAGTGYRAATSDGGTLTFTGTVETGTVAIDIQDSGPAFADWNLVGNPYTSYVDLSAFLSHEVASGVTNLDILEGASGIYGYDGNVADGWDVITLANVGSRLLAPGQGFFVAADGNDVSTYNLEFTPEMRTTGNADDFIAGRDTNEVLTFLKLNISTANKSYTTEFYFNDNASQGLDHGYDAVLWGGSAPSFALYSHLVGDSTGEAIALQALGSSDVSDISIPLGVNANAGEQLRFSIADLNIPETVAVYLEDTSSNTSTLLTNTDYVFTPTSQLTGTGRFYLRFTDNALSTADNPLSRITIFTDTTNKQLVINGIVLRDTKATLYNLQGREVASTLLNTYSTSQYMDISTLQHGVYIAVIRNQQQNVVKKIVVK